MSRDFQPITGKQHKEQGIFTVKEKFYMGGILLGVAGLIFFSNWLYNNMLTPLRWLFGATSPTKEEKQKLRQIKLLKIDGPKTLSKSQALSIANSIYSAMKGTGTDELKLLKNIVKKSYSSKIDQWYGEQILESLDPWSLTPISLLTFDSISNFKTVYNNYRLQISLTPADLLEVYKQFGIRNGRTGYYTLSEYLKEDDGQLYDFYRYVYKDTPVDF